MVYSGESTREDIQLGSYVIKPMALKGIMQLLATDMSKMTDAISREEWEKVIGIADRVADHEQPPLAEKMRILTFLGAEANKFKTYDKKVHDAAVEVKQAAQQGDGYRVIESFSTVQKNCLACHQEFRDRFQAHFYKQ
ncbi:hypothetical protein WG68_16300 [Arsukibacterium ikkense]|uniref:Cytochrome C n=1 Tax=Arsukibacterium ikkense TaxID=336831 RepID=A0A0M2V5E3_9GAMM|nr:hypothetical protein WG68_16300 [Arsukibacterium ikkense]